MTVMVEPSITKTDLCCKKSLIFNARLSMSLMSPEGLKGTLLLVEVDTLEESCDKKLLKIYS